MQELVELLLCYRCPEAMVRHPDVKMDTPYDQDHDAHGIHFHLACRLLKVQETRSRLWELALYMYCQREQNSLI